MNRRVVITGLGLVCGVGNTAPEVWQQLVAGASGMAPIQGFDTTGFPVTFAAEVKNFDPLNFVDKKEARKMGRFIHFAFAATQEAMAAVRPEDHAGDCRSGGRVYRLRHRRIRDHRARARQPAAGRPAQDIAVLYSRDHCEYGGGAIEHSLRSAGVRSRPPRRHAPRAQTRLAIRCE